MMQLPMMAVALSLVLSGTSSDGWQDSDGAHEALDAVAPEWLTVVVADDPGWISSGVMTDLGPYTVVSTHQVVQLRLRDYDIETGEFSSAPSDGKGGGASLVDTNEYCATVASAEERHNVVVCGVWDGYSLAFSHISQVDWVSAKSLNGNEQLIDLAGMGLVVTRGASLLALDDIAQYNIGDTRKMRDVVDALSIRAAQWVEIEQQFEDPPIGGEPPLFGGSPEALSAWDGLVMSAVSAADPLSAEWPETEATLGDIAAVSSGLNLENALPLSGLTCRATVQVDTLQGSFGCFHEEPGEGVQWDVSTTLTAASLDVFALDGVVLDLGPAGIFIAHGQQLTPLDDLGAETLADARDLDEQIEAIEKALDAHNGSTSFVRVWVIGIVVLALVALGIVILVRRRAHSSVSS